MNKTYPLEKFYIYFSPHTAHSITINGIKYPTLEHAYQCLKYAEPKIIEEIRNAESPIKAWQISKKYKQFALPNFDSTKLETMKMLMELKTEQHEDVKRALIESKGLEIIKHIVSFPPGDGFWDDGEDGKGLNHTGKLWMEIRKKLN